MIRGIGTSNGIGIGYVLKVEMPQIDIKHSSVEDAEAEKKRYESVRDRFVEETAEIIESLKKKLDENDKTSLVLKNQIYLIEDVEMNEGILKLIENEITACCQVMDKSPSHRNSISFPPYRLHKSRLLTPSPKVSLFLPEMIAYLPCRVNSFENFGRIS